MELLVQNLRKFRAKLDSQLPLSQEDVLLTLGEVEREDEHRQESCKGNYFFSNNVLWVKSTFARGAVPRCMRASAGPHPYKKDPSLPNVLRFFYLLDRFYFRV